MTMEDQQTPTVASLDQLQINIGENNESTGDHIDLKPLFEPSLDLHTALARSGASSRYQMALVRHILRQKLVPTSEVPLVLANAVTGANARTRIEYLTAATSFGSQRNNTTRQEPYDNETR